MTGFYISPHNPNAEQGGGDLVTPTHQTVDVRGPWVVFPAVDVAEAQGDTPLPHAILPLSIVKQILIEAGGVVADDTGGEGDVRDKIAAPADETTPWEDVPREVQEVLVAQFPKGGRTRFEGGVTTIPTEDSPRLSPPEGKQFLTSSPSVAADLGELPSLTPDGSGELVPVVEPDEADDEVPVI